MPTALSLPPRARAVVVMGRVPAPGRVKTRLAPAIGEALAAELYEAFLLDVFDLVTEAQRALGFSVSFSVLVHEPGELERARALVPNAAWAVVEQRGATLGERIEAARAAPSAEHVVVLGSDSPSMPPERILSAFVALEERGVDAVVGPTRDGGYDLIGFARATPALLEGIPWSSGAVLSATRAAAQAAGLSLLVLEEEGHDIDEPEDLWAWMRAWAEAGPASRVARRSRGLAARRLGEQQKPQARPGDPAGSR